MIEKIFHVLEAQARELHAIFALAGVGAVRSVSAKRLEQAWRKALADA